MYRGPRNAEEALAHYRRQQGRPEAPSTDPLAIIATTGRGRSSGDGDEPWRPGPLRGVWDAQHVPMAMRMLETLSQIAQAQTKAHSVGNAHTLHGPAHDTVPVRFFRDGFMLWEGPPRLYSSREAQDFLQDVLNGRFPFEFLEAHPNGVVFAPVLDLTAGTVDEFRRTARDGPVTVHTMGLPPAPTPGHRFLQKLPASVVRKGRLVPVRQEVARTLGVQPTPSQATPPRPPPGRSDQATLQVRLPDGGVHTIRVDPDDKLCAIRDVVLAKLGPAVHAPPGRAFSLRTSFPRAAYPDNCPRTFRALGLVPSAVLHVHLLV